MSGMNYPHPILAREGWPFIAIAFFLAVFASFFLPGVLALLCWLALAFVVQFFRDPARPIPSETDAVLCPADGRIVKVEKARDPYADRDALLISVFMQRTPSSSSSSSRALAFWRTLDSSRSKRFSSVMLLRV